MRVLHLVDPRRAPWSVFAGVGAAKAAAPCHDHRIVLLGGSVSAGRGASAGLRADLKIAPPLRDPMLARSALRRVLREKGAFDMIHAWSVDAAVLAAGVCPDIAMVASVFESGAPSRARGAGALSRARAVEFVDEACRESWMGRMGEDDAAIRVMVPPMPGADPPRVRGLRERLGIEDGMGVIVANAEPGRTVDAMLAMYIVGVLSERGVPSTVIVPPDATGLDRAQRFAACHMDRWCARVSDLPFWELLSIADGVVVADRPPCDGRRRSESILTGAIWARSMGLPVIAPATERIGRVLGGGVEWVEPGDRLGFVRAAARVLENRGSRTPGMSEGATAGGSLYGLCGLVNT